MFGVFSFGHPYFGQGPALATVVVLPTPHVISAFARYESFVSAFGRYEDTREAFARYDDTVDALADQGEV